MIINRSIIYNNRTNDLINRLNAFNNSRINAINNNQNQHIHNNNVSSRNNQINLHNSYITIYFLKTNRTIFILIFSFDFFSAPGA